jgi:hypothetical protein
MSDLPTREHIRDYLNGDFGGFSKEKGEWLLAVDWAYADGVLMTEAEWRDSIEQIGWFNPGSKRFCYPDDLIVVGDAEKVKEDE